MSPDQLKKRTVLVHGRTQIQRTSVPIKSRRDKNAVEIEVNEDVSGDFFDLEDQSAGMKSAAEQFEAFERAKAEEAAKKEAEDAAKKAAEAKKNAPTQIVLEDKFDIFAPVEMEEVVPSGSVVLDDSEEEVAPPPELQGLGIDFNFYDVLGGGAQEAPVAAESPKEEFYFSSKSEGLPQKEEDMKKIPYVEVKAEVVLPAVVFEEALPVKPPQKKKPKVVDFSAQEDLSEVAAPSVSVEVSDVVASAEIVVEKRKPKVVDFSSHRDLSDSGEDPTPVLKAPEVVAAPIENPAPVSISKSAEDVGSVKLCLFVKPNGERCKRQAPKSSDYCAAHRKAK